MDPSKCVFPDKALQKLGETRTFLRGERVCVRGYEDLYGGIFRGLYVRPLHNTYLGYGSLKGEPLLRHEIEIDDSSKKILQVDWVNIGKFKGLQDDESSAFSKVPDYWAGLRRRKSRKSRKQALKKRRTTRKR